MRAPKYYAPPYSRIYDISDDFPHDLCSPVLDKQLPFYHTVRFEDLLLTKWTTLTPLNAVMFEKLTVLQAIKTVTCTLWNPTVRYRFHKCRPHVLTVRKITPAYPLPPFHLSISILPRHLGLWLPSVLLFPDFPIETQYAFIFSSKYYAIYFRVYYIISGNIPLWTGPSDSGTGYLQKCYGLSPVNKMFSERGLWKWLTWWTEGNMSVLKLSKSVAKLSKG
jgi:hypothetical protein